MWTLDPIRRQSVFRFRLNSFLIERRIYTARGAATIAPIPTLRVMRGAAGLANRAVLAQLQNIAAPGAWLRFVTLVDLQFDDGIGLNQG
jgi:hypothetical protein